MKFRFCGDLDCPDWVLAEVATLSKFSSVRIKVLVIQILSYCIQGTFNYDKVLKLASDNSDGVADIKGAVAAVHFIITNAAKFDLDEQSLVQEIQQLGLPKENSDALARQYREHKDLLQAKFAEDSYRISRLLSTEWRIDHVIASSEDESASAESTSSGQLIHLKFLVDTRPHDGHIVDIEDVEVDGTRLQEIACELSGEKLDVLIHELTNATSILDSLQS